MRLKRKVTLTQQNTEKLVVALRPLFFKTARMSMFTSDKAWVRFRKYNNKAGLQVGGRPWTAVEFHFGRFLLIKK